MVLITGILAVVFDTTIVNIALDTLARDLQVGVSTVQWVTTAYLLRARYGCPCEPDGSSTDSAAKPSGWARWRCSSWARSVPAFLLGRTEPCRVSRGAGDRWRSDAASADDAARPGSRWTLARESHRSSWHCRCCWGPFSVP